MINKNAKDVKACDKAAGKPSLKILRIFLKSGLMSFNDNVITDFLSNLSKCLSMLIATICVAAFAYLITVGLIMCTSNIF